MNMNFNQIIEQAENRLLSLGYLSKHCYEDQLDCVINGIAFAIYGSDEDETFGYGCIFEPASGKYADGFLEELQARFKGKYAPFQNLLMCDEGFIHLEGECEIYTDRLIDDIVNVLVAENGIASAIKSKSYKWEEN